MRKFTGKHNVFRNDMMSRKMPNSATAVWTADPRLDIDQVGMGPEMMKSMGLRDDDYVCIWRDPILRDGGLRYLRVRGDDTLVGVSINPVMDKSFDGDFDGDSVGVLKLTTKEAKRQAMEKLTVEANLLDKGVCDENGNKPLYMQNGLDMSMTSYHRPELDERRQVLEDRINVFEKAYAAGEMEYKDVRKERKAAMKDLNAYVHESLAPCGSLVVSYDNLRSHILSLETCVESGAKGSYSKLAEYGRYLGVTWEMDEKTGKINPDTIVDHGESLATREDDNAVQFATAVKAFGTGVAGMFSQRGIAVGRNICPEAVNEITYKVTQTVLQIKHDPEQAENIYKMLMGPARDLWRGYEMESRVDADGKRHWSAVRDDQGKPVMATSEQFKKQFIEIYTSKDGMNVDLNPKHVDDVCRLLTDEKTGRMRNLMDRAGREEAAAPLDMLAYGGDFTTLKMLAEQNANIYKGKYNHGFAPSVILENEKRLEKGEPLKGFGKQDVMEAGAEKSVKTPAVYSVTHTSSCRLPNGERKVPDTPDVTLSDVKEHKTSPVD